MVTIHKMQSLRLGIHVFSDKIKFENFMTSGSGVAAVMMGGRGGVHYDGSRQW